MNILCRAGLRTASRLPRLVTRRGKQGARSPTARRGPRPRPRWPPCLSPTASLWPCRLTLGVGASPRLPTGWEAARAEGHRRSTVTAPWGLAPPPMVIFSQPGHAKPQQVPSWLPPGLRPLSRRGPGSRLRLEVAASRPGVSVRSCVPGRGAARRSSGLWQRRVWEARFNSAPPTGLGNVRPDTTACARPGRCPAPSLSLQPQKGRGSVFCGCQEPRLLLGPP